MASGTIQHADPETFASAMHFASVSVHPLAACSEVNEKVNEDMAVTATHESLAGARGAMLAILVEAAAMLSLFAAWALLRFL